MFSLHPNIFQINFSELPKFKKYSVNNDVYIRQRGAEKKNHDVYIRQAGAFIKNWWANRTVFSKVAGVERVNRIICWCNQ